MPLARDLPVGYQLLGAMTVRRDNSILRELISSFSVTLFVGVIASVCSPRPAAAQSSAADSSTVAAIAADDDPADNIDRPAPSVDYDQPAEAAATARGPDAEPDDSTDDQVLELPQVIDPATYATVSSAPAPSSADAADGSADPADVAVSNLPTAPQSDPNDQSAQATADADDDAQSYADQDDDGSGPVVVYAAPVYVPVYPASTQADPPPEPNTTRLPMYSALSYRLLPMYSGLGPVGPGRYNVPGGSRLWDSPLGQGFGMARSSMMGGFLHAR